MKSKAIIYSLFTLLITISNFAQQRSYSITKLEFCSNVYHEFSPEPYGSALIFCSDIPVNKLLTRQTDKSQSLTHIYQVQKKDSTQWTKPELLSAQLLTGLNEGPACITYLGKVLYFSANRQVDEISPKKTTRTLGIYFSKTANDTFASIHPFEHNSSHYNVFAPSVSFFGDKLFFASDMPGGYGGFDLYYCNRTTTGWDRPMNLGSTFNTSGNEVYPYIHPSGKLYFSSDYQPVYGGKDIYFSESTDGIWKTPELLPEPINSPADDVGFKADLKIQTGYFSSNRDGTYDIFNFRNISPE